MFVKESGWARLFAARLADLVYCIRQYFALCHRDS